MLQAGNDKKAQPDFSAQLRSFSVWIGNSDFENWSYWSEIVKSQRERLTIGLSTIVRHGIWSFRICRSELDKLKIKYDYPVAKTGIIGRIGHGKPLIALRTDMDALPIQVFFQFPISRFVSSCLKSTDFVHSIQGSLVLYKISAQRLPDVFVTSEPFFSAYNIQSKFRNYPFPRLTFHLFQKQIYCLCQVRSQLNYIESLVVFCSK